MPQFIRQSAEALRATHIEDPTPAAPTLPYALWTTSALYGDAWADMPQKSAKDADILRAFWGGNCCAAEGTSVGAALFAI